MEQTPIINKRKMEGRDKEKKKRGEWRDRGEPKH